ncbi:MAG: LysR family transcriptional regulator [Salinisphaera sp.]|nr:LysR family transcriptional regulator [Salinisphaera sp.]
MHVTIRQLGIFNAVAEQLSFTRAAAQLYLTQPAVSLQIRRLEEQVGLPLFEQLGKRIFLTDAGRELVGHSHRIFDELDEAREMIAQMKDISRGTLSIAVATTASSFATRLIAAFVKQHPGATVRLDVTNRRTLIEQLGDNQKDVVVMGQPPDDLDVVGEAFMENPLMVIASPDHPLAGRKRIPIEELGTQPFVVRESGSGTRSAMQRLFEQHDIRPAISIEIADNGALKEAVAAGLGLGVVSLHTLEPELQIGSLVTLNAEHFPILRHWYLVCRKGKRLSPIVLAFKAFVFEHAADLAQG